MPRRCNSTYSRLTAQSDYTAPPAAAAAAAGDGPVVVTANLFRQLTDQMRLLTEGLAVTRTDLDEQKVELTGAKADLQGTNNDLALAKADLLDAKIKNAALRQQIATQENQHDFSKIGNGDQHRFNSQVIQHPHGSCHSTRGGKT